MEFLSPHYRTTYLKQRRDVPHESNRISDWDWFLSILIDGIDARFISLVIYNNIDISIVQIVRAFAQQSMNNATDWCGK